MDAPPDGGYGWVVLAACIVCQGMTVSLQRIAGLVVLDIIDIYRVNRTEAFSVLVVYRLVNFMFAPIIAKFFTRFPYRIILCTGSLLLCVSLILTSFSTAYWQIILAYGCVRGIASSCIITGSNISVELYFQKRRSLVMSLFYGATGTVGFMAPMVFHWLREVYEFHGAILIFGSISLHACASSILVRQPSWIVHTKMAEPLELLQKEMIDEKITNDEEKTKLNSHSKHGRGLYDYTECKAEDPQPGVLQVCGKVSYAQRILLHVKSALKDFGSDFRLYKDGSFLLIVSNLAVVDVTRSHFISLLPDYVEHEFEFYVSKQDIAYLVSIYCIGEIVAKFSIGFISDKLPWEKKYSLAGVTAFIGFTVFSFQYMQNYTQLVFGVVFYGLGAGMQSVLQYLVEMDIMGPHRIHIARGLNRFTVGFVTVLTGLLIGHLRDQLNSYKVCIAILGGLGITGGLIWTAEPFVFKFCPPQPVKKSSNDNNDNTLNK